MDLIVFSPFQHYVLVKTICNYNNNSLCACGLSAGHMDVICCPDNNGHHNHFFLSNMAEQHCFCADITLC